MIRHCLGIAKPYKGPSMINIISFPQPVFTVCLVTPASMIFSTDVGLMLVQHQRCCPNIEPTLVQCILLTGKHCEDMELIHGGCNNEIFIS